MKNLPPILKEQQDEIIRPAATAPLEDEDDSRSLNDIHEASNCNTNSNTTTRNANANATPYDADDERAILQAARHRQHAQNLVREHLEHHTEQNPGASSDYVTWIATLHPENADITIDQRFFVTGNPWWTIYEDTKNNPIPMATAVPVSNGEAVEEDLEGGTKTESPSPESAPTSSTTSSSTRSTTTTSSTRRKRTGPHFCQTCNPIALLAGILMTIPAFVVVLTYELVALLVFFVPATMFYHAAEAFSPPNICTCLLYLVFTILHGAFALADSIMLVVSVVAAELIGMVALLVGFLTGGCLWARFLQQHIRRLCHGIRVSFRRKSEDDKGSSKTLRGSMPPRGLYCCGGGGCCGCYCCGDKSASQQRAADRERNVQVIRVQRVRRAGESFH